MDGSVAGVDHARTPVPSGLVAERGFARHVGDFLARQPFVLLVLAFGAVVSSVLLPGFVGSDTWLALVVGRHVASHWIPQRDTLTIWSHGASWVDQQWLGQLVLYGLHAAGGLRLLLLANLALLVGSTSLALAFAVRSGGSSRSVALVGTIAVLVALPSSGARTQVLAYPLFVALFWLLASGVGRRTRRVFLAWPILVLWANVHGSALLGVGLVATWAVAEIVRARRRAGAARVRLRAVVLAVVAPLCLLASPYGLQLPAYYHDVLGSGAFRDVVTEWAPTTVSGHWLFFLFAVAALWLTARRPERLTLFEHLALLGTGLAALDAIRNIVWFALVALMVVPRALDGVWPLVEAPLRPRVNRALSLLALAAIVCAFGAAAVRPYSYYTRGYPHQALASVSSTTTQDPSLQVFANERFADWLLWKLPRLSGRVAFDARFELLGATQIRAISRFRSHEQPSLAPAAGYRLLVLDPRVERAAIRAILREPGATLRYRDKQVAVLLRRATRAAS